MYKEFMKGVYALYAAAAYWPDPEVIYWHGLAACLQQLPPLDCYVEGIDEHYRYLLLAYEPLGVDDRAYWVAGFSHDMFNADASVLVRESALWTAGNAKGFSAVGALRELHGVHGLAENGFLWVCHALDYAWVREGCVRGPERAELYKLPMEAQDADTLAKSIAYARARAPKFGAALPTADFDLFINNAVQNAPTDIGFDTLHALLRAWRSPLELVRLACAVHIDVSAFSSARQPCTKAAILERITAVSEADLNRIPFITH